MLQIFFKSARVQRRANSEPSSRGEPFERLTSLECLPELRSVLSRLVVLGAQLAVANFAISD
jgi:hypothetical protein